ncbi:MAG: MEKHLA domain-containing protein [Nitrospirae bacterium]|nr:MAG: MEKHLA domain-containing protein [Nitrospirota bacterium]
MVPRICERKIWEAESIVSWTQWLLNSFRFWTGRELIVREGSLRDQAKCLFECPMVVVSHGIEADPLLNYGNRAALDLWESSWAEFIGMPSRLTAEPQNQAERARMLQRVEQNGFVDDYRGVRISKRGRRFLVDRAFVWNVVDLQGQRRGQAAAFSNWLFLD